MDPGKFKAVRYNIAGQVDVLIDGDVIRLLQPLSGYIQELASRRKRVMKFFVNISSFHAAGCQASDEVFEQPATRITFLTPYLGPYEIYAFADEAHSTALGATMGVNGPFWSEIDLSALPYQFGASRDEHSAQFNYTIMRSWSYWSTLSHTSFGL